MSQLDFHSKAIGWLKIILPLAALALLSTLFLVARTVNPEDAIPFAEVNVADRIREPRMTDATFVTITDDGSSLTIDAAEVRPDTENGSGRATTMTGMLEMPGGVTANLKAAGALMDSAKRLVTLSGGVEIATSTGWVLHTEALKALLDRTEISADQPVMAEGPAGKVTADTMRIAESSEMPGKYVLVFNGRVKLIYSPEK